MSLLEILAAKSIDKRAVLNDSFHFLSKITQNVVCLSLFELHLQLRVFVIVSFDLLDNGCGILLTKGVVVPDFLEIFELSPIVPKSESLVKFLLIDVHLR